LRGPHQRQRGERAHGPREQRRIDVREMGGRVAVGISPVLEVERRLVEDAEVGGLGRVDLPRADRVQREREREQREQQPAGGVRAVVVVVEGLSETHARLPKSADRRAGLTGACYDLLKMRWLWLVLIAATCRAADIAA